MTQLSKKIQRKNEALQGLILDLVEASRENDAPIWRTVAETLSSPTRQQPTVNLYELNDYDTDQALLIPGKVLGTGVLQAEGLTVVAHKFSSSAKEAIKDNDGTAQSIREYLKDNETGENVRLLI